MGYYLIVVNTNFRQGRHNYWYKLCWVDLFCSQCIDHSSVTSLITVEYIGLPTGTGHGNTVSLVVQVEGHNDKFVVSINNDIAVVTWDGVSSKPSSVEVIATLEGNEERTRINDGKVDPAGRLWAGNFVILSTLI